MTRPKAYDPVHGCKYQILCREKRIGQRDWDHCDYAKSKEELNYILEQYNLSYRGGFEFKVITLPKKYWSKEAK